MRRRLAKILSLAVVGLGLAACDDEGKFVEACMSDGKAFKQACECTYQRLKADRRDAVIEAVILHANRERSIGLSEEAFVFAGAYLKCQL